ncbi:MAG: hypothetical protein C5B56_10025 [Proteobacteria bacterium]|nr:MAG: hypothetical protein C5B56_10025 [Pseudomonadota bacterium]
MLKGFYLTLLIGPGLPAPAPKVVMDAVLSVQASNGGARGGFQITFAVSKPSDLTRVLIPAGYFDPGIRVCIVVTVGGMPNVLMDGIITRHELAPSNTPGGSTFTITGEDLSVLMDIVEMPFMRWPCMPAPARVLAILAKYAIFGIVPVVIPPIFLDVPIPTDKIPAQTKTDLNYIQALGQQNGHVFYIDPGPAPLSNVAYWGPEFVIPNPQPALRINMDADTNVESLTFSLDGLSKKITIQTIFDPVTGSIPIPIPVPNISLLEPPLGVRLTAPMKVEFPDDSTKLGSLKAIALALARGVGATQEVTASGQLNVLRYGRVLKARQMVGVAGASLAYDGMYYVKSVTSNIKNGEFKQSFSLSRDGLISQTPKVVP